MSCKMMLSHFHDTIFQKFIFFTYLNTNLEVVIYNMGILESPLVSTRQPLSALELKLLGLIMASQVDTVGDNQNAMTVVISKLCLIKILDDVNTQIVYIFTLKKLASQ